MILITHDCVIRTGCMCKALVAWRPKRVHGSDGRSLAGASLAAETDELRDEESRLKAGCSHDWLPHKRPTILGYFAKLYPGGIWNEDGCGSGAGAFLQ